jgi:hypothetical protein
MSFVSPVKVPTSVTALWASVLGGGRGVEEACCWDAGGDQERGWRGGGGGGGGDGRLDLYSRYTTNVT